MLHIHCPYCEEYREEEEFNVVGEAHIIRPLAPEALSDEQWASYLFFRKILVVYIMKCGRIATVVASFLI